MAMPSYISKIQCKSLRKCITAFDQRIRVAFEGRNLPGKPTEKENVSTL